MAHPVCCNFDFKIAFICLFIFSDTQQTRTNHERSASVFGGDAGASSALSDKERKIGHRRVNEAGEVSFKKVSTNQLMGSIQLGIGQAIGALNKYDERDLLMQDFMTVETTHFAKSGSSQTPAHSFRDELNLRHDKMKFIGQYLRI